jgi:hypothetical protein
MAITESSISATQASNESRIDRIPITRVGAQLSLAESTSNSLSSIRLHGL